MKNSLLDLIMPYNCRGCGKVGDVLCEDCVRKLVRKKITKRQVETDGLFESVVVVGWREGLLKTLVEEYKFKSVRRMAAILAELINETLKRDKVKLMEKVYIVPLPTIGRHIRERGFDHTARLAKELSKRTGWKVEKALLRRNKTVQVGANEEKRLKQAKEAYGLRAGFRPEDGATYVLLDDVWTTGASMRAGAKVLRGATQAKIQPIVIEMGK